MGVGVGVLDKSIGSGKFGFDLVGYKSKHICQIGMCYHFYDLYLIFDVLD